MSEVFLFIYPMDFLYSSSSVYLVSDVGESMCFVDSLGLPGGNSSAMGKFPSISERMFAPFSFTDLGDSIAGSVYGDTSPPLAIVPPIYFRCTL